jgi:hypothetical protein
MACIRALSSPVALGCLGRLYKEDPMKPVLLLFLLTCPAVLGCVALPPSTAEPHQMPPGTDGGTP